MTDNPTPITDPHAAFARAIVALCREHGCDNIQATFRLASSRTFRLGKDDYTSVRMWWSEGRHGVQNPIGLRAEASVGITEKAPADGVEQSAIAGSPPIGGM